MDIIHLRCRIALLLFFLLNGTLTAHDVIGLVLFPDSSDHDSIRVTIQGDVTDTVYTTSIGSYSFTDLTTNFYRFSYYYPGYQETWLGPIAITSTQILPQMTLSPIPDTFRVQGVVRCGRDTVHDSVLVTVRSPEGSLLDTVRTDPDGGFTAICADSGHLTFSFRKLGFRTLRDTLRIISDTVVPDTFRLESTPVVSGVARLYDRSAHDGIAVTMARGDSVYDSVSTGTDGAWALSIPDTGYYNLSFKKENWHSRTITSLHILSDTLLDTVFLDTFSTDTVYAGTLKTDQRWTADHVRLLKGDVTVDSGVTLTIEAGTRVRPAATDSLNTGLDKNMVELTVRGTLAAEGDSGSVVNIYNSLSAGSYSWRGIRASGPAASVSLRHCLIADAYTGVRADSGGSITMTDGNVRLNLIGMLVTGGTMQLADTRVEQNTGSGILCTRSTAGISGCKLYNNGGNPLSISDGTVSVFNTFIYKNNGTAGCMISDSAEVFLYNCTVAQNGLYGLTNTRSRTVLFNNIFTGHTQNAVSNDATAISAGIEIAWNLFFDNGVNAFRNCPADLEDLTTVTAAGDSCDRYYNLYTDPGLTYWPAFVTLADTSSCIKSGTDLFVSVQTGDTVRIVTDSAGVLPNRGHDTDISHITALERPDGTVPAGMTGRELWFRLDGKQVCPDIGKHPGIYIRVTPDGAIRKAVKIRR